MLELPVDGHGLHGLHGLVGLVRIRQLHVLNQLRLPFEEAYEAVGTAEEAWHQIRDMKVGAPAVHCIQPPASSRWLTTLGGRLP